MKARRVLMVLALASLILSSLAATLPAAAAGAITEYPVPTAKATPRGITRGPDGNLWVAEFYANKIAKVTPAGNFTEYPILTNGLPQEITAGPDGNLWFTEFGGGSIGRITLTGTVTEFFIRPITTGRLNGITGGPDGNVWFTQTDRISRITPDGTIIDFPFMVPGAGPGGGPRAITTGPDGNLWFTEGDAARIGKITPTGAITEFTGLTSNRGAFDITPGPDGNLWFTESGTNMVGKITPAGTITEYPVPAPAILQDITTGPDGNLWAATDNGKIEQITPDGTVTEYIVPTAMSEPRGIVAGPDGNIWFTENTSNMIGMVSLS